MAIINKKNQIHLRCINPEVLESKSEGWTGKIDENAAGLAAAIWAPDSRQILAYSEFNLRVTVWSLVKQDQVAMIKNHKLLPPKGLSFSKNKNFMAFAERRDLKDWVSIYYTQDSWKMVNTFEVDTFDMSDFEWCKADSAILIWDTPLENKLLIYSAMTGQVIA